MKCEIKLYTIDQLYEVNYKGYCQAISIGIKDMGGNEKGVHTYYKHSNALFDEDGKEWRQLWVKLK